MPNSAWTRCFETSKHSWQLWRPLARTVFSTTSPVFGLRTRVHIARAHCPGVNLPLLLSLPVLPGNGAHTTTSLTAIAVCMSWAQAICSASAEAMVLQDAANRLSKDDCELLIAHMVQRGILQLDFGFTAYATNTYLTAAPRAPQMLAGVISQRHQYLMAIRI